MYNKLQIYNFSKFKEMCVCVCMRVVRVFATNNAHTCMSLCALYMYCVCIVCMFLYARFVCVFVCVCMYVFCLCVCTCVCVMYLCNFVQPVLVVLTRCRIMRFHLTHPTESMAVATVSSERLVLLASGV